MGNFYTNITLRGSNQDSIVEFLTQQKRRAFVSPTVGECTVVYDEECESQDTRILEELAANLSRQFNCPALAVLNHDDDILWYRLFDAGQPLDEYNSSPDYFDGDEDESPLPKGGDVRRLCRAFKAEQSVTEVERVLRAVDEDYVFSSERHEDLFKALGIPTFSVGCGYNYLQEGDLPEGLDSDSLKHTGES